MPLHKAPVLPEEPEAFFEVKHLLGTLRVSKPAWDQSPHSCLQAAAPTHVKKETEVQLGSGTCPAHKPSEQTCLGRNSDLPLSSVLAHVPSAQWHLLLTKKRGRLLRPRPPYSGIPPSCTCRGFIFPFKLCLCFFVCSITSPLSDRYVYSLSLKLDSKLLQITHNSSCHLLALRWAFDAFASLY